MRATHDVGGSLKAVGTLLQRSLSSDVLALLVHPQEGVVVVQLLDDPASEGEDDKVGAEFLELSHSLERGDGLEGHPTGLVASGEGEEELVVGEVRVGEVEVDCVGSALSHGPHHGMIVEGR